MTEEERLKHRWNEIVERLSAQFADGETLNLEAIIYLIGVQELGQLKKKYKKDDKINLMHIAICTLLEPYGYYKFSHFDEQKWPHYDLVEQLPPLKSGEQTILMKKAIVHYFEKNHFFDDFS